MKKINLLSCLFSVASYLACSSSIANVVDFSQCSASSSFAIVTQSEGPTYACGGVDTGAGNPINVLNGNKFEAVEDFKELPSFKGLSFSRFYNSQSHANTALGFGWYSTYDIKLYDQPEIIQVRMESGQRINFKKSKISLGNGQFVVRAIPLNPNDGWIEKKIDGSGWLWHKSNSNQDYFFQQLGGKDLNLAHLSSISASSVAEKSNPGLNFSFLYDQQQRLVSVKNGKGDQLSFAYSLTKLGLAQITITTPIGQYFYFLDKNNNLAQVVYPDGRRFKYSYDPKFQGGDIHNLTSKWVFDRKANAFKLISEWHYDKQDRATLSQHADGVEKVTIQYDARTNGAMPANYSSNKPIFKNIVTNSLGQNTTYSYQIDGSQFRLQESLGAGCSSCGSVNKRYRFSPQGLVSYAADLDPKGNVIRSIDLKYNDLGEVIVRTVSGIGVQPQTTYYEYEVFQSKSSNVFNAASLLDQLSQRDSRRLKAEFRQSVVAGKQYRKSYSYNQDNRLISVKESGFSPLGDVLVRESKYGYDQQGRLAWEDGPLKNGPTNSPKDSDIRKYQYNTLGQLQALAMPGQQSVQVLSFDTINRPESIKVTDGNRSIQIDLSYHHSTLQVTKYVYRADNKIHSIENQFNDYGELISTRNGLQQTDFIYDLLGRLIETKSLNGLNSTKQYNSENLITSEKFTDRDGKLVQNINNKFIIGSDSRSIDVSDTLGLISRTSQSGMFTEQTDALNRIFTQQIDGLGRTVANQLNNPSKQQVSSTLSSYQQGQASQFSAGLQHNKWMDDFGRTVITQSPAIGLKLFKFNESDLAIEIIDEKGFIQKNKYDYANNLVESSVKNPETQQEVVTQKTVFDGSKPIRKVSQDEIQQWRYAQDGKLLTHTTTQLDKAQQKNGIQAINFIAEPQRIKQVEDILSGKSTNSNLTVITWSENYRYDENGLLLSETRRDLTIDYVRDETGKVIGLNLNKNGEKAHIDQIQWNAVGQLTHYRLSSGQQLWRSYDSRGRLTQQRWYIPKSQSWWESLVERFKYQWLNQDIPKSKIQTSDYVYDQANRLIYNNEAGREFYQYDDKDQLLAIWKSDSNHSLTRSWYPAQVYAYDAQGNRRLKWQKSDKKQAELIDFYRYGESGDASVQLLGVSQHLVNKGNIQTGQLTRIASYAQTGQPHAWWQAEPELKTVLDYVPSANSGAPVWDTSSPSWRGVNDQHQNVSIDQQFDQQGMVSKRAVTFNTPRQQREFSQRNGHINGLRVWEQQRLRMENEQVSDIHSPEIHDVVVDRDYVMLAGLPVMQFSQIATQKLNGNLESTSASFNAVQFNRIGAPIQVFDENNSSRWKTDYSAFGERLNTVSTHQDEAKLVRVNQNLAISQSMDDLRYTISIRLPGQNEDPITGLYDNGYRQYDPTVGRYLTPDPMGTIDGLNPYLYVGNNPLNKVDPYGLYQTDMHYYITYFLAITAGIDSDNARRIALATQFVDVNEYTAPMHTGHESIYHLDSLPLSLLDNAFTKRLEWYHFTNIRNGVSQIYDYESWDLAKPKNMSESEYRLWRLTSNLDKNSNVANKTGILQLEQMKKNYKKASECNNINLSMQFFGEYLHAFEDTFAHRDQNNDPYPVSGGLGHAAGGTHPDHTYNNEIFAIKDLTVLGLGKWEGNADRTLLSEAAVYAKLLEFRRDILKVPDNKVKIIPWKSLVPYLKAFNAIKENHDEGSKGSLNELKDKISFLEEILNSKGGRSKFVLDPKSDLPIGIPLPNWNYSKNFDLITFSNGNYVKGSDGFSVPQSLVNRIDVLSKIDIKDHSKFPNVIWSTQVSRYISSDNESSEIQKQVRNYKFLVYGRAFGSPYTGITGKPPKVK